MRIQDLLNPATGSTGGPGGSGGGPGGPGGPGVFGLPHENTHNDRQSSLDSLLGNIDDLLIENLKRKAQIQLSQENNFSEWSSVKKNLFLKNHMRSELITKFKDWQLYKGKDQMLFNDYSYIIYDNMITNLFKSKV